jgi:hypothetical protein
MHAYSSSLSRHAERSLLHSTCICIYNIVADIHTCKKPFGFLLYLLASENLVTGLFYVPPRLILKEPLESSFEELVLGILWIIMSLHC